MREGLAAGQGSKDRTRVRRASALLYSRILLKINRKHRRQSQRFASCLERSTLILGACSTLTTLLAFVNQPRVRRPSGLAADAAVDERRALLDYKYILTMSRHCPRALQSHPSPSPTSRTRVMLANSASPSPVYRLAHSSLATAQRHLIRAFKSSLAVLLSTTALTSRFDSSSEPC